MRRSLARLLPALLLPIASPAVARAALFEPVEVMGARSPRAPAVASVRLDARSVAGLRRAGGGRASLPIGGGAALALVLEPVDPFAGGRVVAHDGTRERTIAARPDVYRVRVEGEPGAWGVLSFADGRAMGSVTARGTRFSLASEPGGAAHAIVDESRREEARTFECGVEEDAVSSDPRRPERLRAQQALAALPTPWRLQCRIFLDADYEFYAVKFGSDLSACTQYLATLVATVSALYERDLNITVTVDLLTIWTDANDPWTGANTQVALDEYTGWHALNRLGVPRSLAHLVSGRPLGGGRAWFDGLCNVQKGYAVSQLDGFYTYPTASTTWDAMVFAHEMGHNMGSRHTHSCFWQDLGLAPAGALLDSCFTAEDACYTGPTGTAYQSPGRGTIMSYCHTGPYGMNGIRMEFHPSCIAWMRAEAQSGCLAIAPPQPPFALLAGPAPQGGVVLDWRAPPNTPGITGYEVFRHALPFDPDPTSLGTTTATSFHHPAGDASGFYRVRTLRTGDASFLTGQVASRSCAIGRLTSHAGGSSAVAVAARDFNLDGVLDVAAADSAGQRVTVLRGQRCALCESEYAIPFHYALDFAPRALAVADLDRDGLEDLVVGGESGSRFAVLRGQGGGNASFAPVAGMSSPVAVADLAIADFDRDGWLDVAFVDGTTDSAWVLPGADPGGNPTVAFGARAGHGVPAAGLAIAAQDVDADGCPDLAVGTATGFLVLPGTCGGFESPVAFALPAAASDLALGDFDHDDVLDVAACGPAGVWVSPGLGGAGFGPAVVVSGAGAPALAIGDVSRDGHPDLVFARLGDVALGLAAGDGALGFAAPVPLVLPSAAGAVVLADHDGHERLAVIAGLATGTVAVARMACAGFVTGELDLTTPTQGGIWVTGEPRLIEWTAGSGVLAAEVQVSFDDGAIWRTVSPPVWSNGYVWQVEGPFTETARLRVRDALIPARVALDDGPFTIIPADVVGVTSGPSAALQLAPDGAHPARGGLAVRFAVPAAGNATLELLDVAGRRVARLDPGALPAGEHRARFDALAPGLYFVRLAHRGARVTMRAVVLE